MGFRWWSPRPRPWWLCFGASELEKGCEGLKALRIETYSNYTRVEGTGQFNLKKHFLKVDRLTFSKIPRCITWRSLISWSYIPRFAEETPCFFLASSVPQFPITACVFFRFFRSFLLVKNLHPLGLSPTSLVESVLGLDVSLLRLVAQHTASCRWNEGRYGKVPGVMSLSHPFLYKIFVRSSFPKSTLNLQTHICHTIKCVLVIREAFGSYFSNDYQLLMWPDRALGAWKVCTLLGANQLKQMSSFHGKNDFISKYI